MGMCILGLSTFASYPHTRDYPLFFLIFCLYCTHTLLKHSLFKKEANTGQPRVTRDDSFPLLTK